MKKKKKNKVTREEEEKPEKRACVADVQVSSSLSPSFAGKRVLTGKSARLTLNDLIGCNGRLKAIDDLLLVCLFGDEKRTVGVLCSRRSRLCSSGFGGDLLGE